MSSSDESCFSSEDILCDVTKWVWRVVPIVLVAIGTPGNILNIAVLCRQNLRSKPFFILTFLAFFDLVCVWSFLPWYSLNFGYNINLEDVSLPFCLVCAWLLYSGASSSVCTIAIFTIERAFSVWFPVLYRNRPIKKLGLYSLTLTSVIIWSLIGTDIIGYVTLDSGVTVGSNSSTTSFNTTERTMCWSVQANQGPTRLAIYVIVACIGLSVPIILVGNIALLIKLSTRQRRSESPADPQTKILLVVTCTFITTQLPALMAVLTLSSLYKQYMSFSRLLHAITTCLAGCNFALNFVCYIWKCNVFRNEAKEMWREIKEFLLCKENAD